MNRLDRGVGAVPLGLWRKTKHQDPRDQPAQTDHQRDRPGPGEFARREAVALTDRQWGLVPADRLQQQFRRGLQGEDERDRAHTRHDTDQRPEHQPLAQVVAVLEAGQQGFHGATKARNCGRVTSSTSANGRIEPSLRRERPAKSNPGPLTRTGRLTMEPWGRARLRLQLGGT